MTIKALVFNLETINNLNPKARKQVADNAASVIKRVLEVADGHNLKEMPYNWYVDAYQGQPCCSEGGCVKCTCYGNEGAGVTAGFICDCVNAVRWANLPVGSDLDGVEREPEPKPHFTRYCAAPRGHFCDDAIADEKSGCDICTRRGDCEFSTAYPAVAAEQVATVEAQERIEP